MLTRRGKPGPPTATRDVGDGVEISISRTTAGSVPIVAVSGEVDVYSAPALKDKITELIASGEHTLIVDLGNVAFLDSTGLGALVEARTATVESGGSMPVVCEQERILKLFTITGLDGVFTIHPSIGDAVAALGRA
jgi:anti-sigma B factor antagonist